MKNSTLSVVVSVFFFLLGTMWLHHCYALDFSTQWTQIGGPGTFPFLVLCIMTAGFGVVAMREYKKMRRGDDTRKLDLVNSKRVLALVVAAFAYVLLLELTGYFLTTALLLLVSLFLFGERDKRILVAVPILFSAALWVLFLKFLEVQLPAMSLV